MIKIMWIIYILLSINFKNISLKKVKLSSFLFWCRVESPFVIIPASIKEDWSEFPATQMVNPATTDNGIYRYNGDNDCQSPR